MKKNKLFIMGLLGSLSALPSQAQDIYLYKTGEYTKYTFLESVVKLTLAPDQLVVSKADQTTENISYDTFDYMRFYKTPIPTGINEAKTENGVRIHVAGRTVEVSSQDPMSLVEICSVDGVCRTSLRPESTRVSIPFDAYQKGVYLIKVEAAGKTTVRKIKK